MARHGPGRPTTSSRNGGDATQQESGRPRHEERAAVEPTGLSFQILGPLAALGPDGRPLDLGPRKQRAVLALRYYEGHTDAQIAELLGCSEATVRSHAARGLAALRSAATPTVLNGG